MRKLFKFFGMVIFALGLFFLYFLLGHLLWPWKFFNPLAFFFVIYIMGWEKSWFIWFALLLYFFLELYALSPFGFVLLPGMLSVILTYLVYLYILTNRSWSSATLLTAWYILINRLGFILLVGLADFSFLRKPAVWAAFGQELFWEIFITAFFSATVIFILILKTNRFASKKIKFTYD